MDGSLFFAEEIKKEIHETGLKDAVNSPTKGRILAGAYQSMVLLFDCSRISKVRRSFPLCRQIPFLSSLLVFIGACV